MEAVLTISTTWGTTDPTKATIPFHLARGAKQAGIEVRMVLAGDSTDLIRTGVAEVRRALCQRPWCSRENSVSRGEGALAVILDRRAYSGIRRRGPDADPVAVGRGRVDVIAHTLLIQIVARVGREEVARQLIEHGRPSSRSPI